jgi:NTP pyrophosphatase (non-canonical NTP hydrolase)
MTFDEYQKQALTTAHVDQQFKGTLMEQTIWAMGIAGEAGEVIEKWKKIVAYKEGIISDDERNELGKEMADVVWYIAVLADSLNLSFDEIMKINVAKLADRKKRNVIKGKGDNR